MSSREQLTAASEDSEPVPSQASDAVRSTLRPTGDDPPFSLQPSTRRPMVVVRSGDGANVPDWSAESPTPPVAFEITAIPAAVDAAEAAAPSIREPLPSEPSHSEPFPLARDLEPPPSARLATDPVSTGAPDEPALDSAELPPSGAPLASPEAEPVPAPAAALIPSESSAPTPATPTPAAPASDPAISSSVAPPSAHSPARAPERTSSRRGWARKLAAPAFLAALGLVYLGTRSAPEPAKPQPEPAARATRAEAVPRSEAAAPDERPVAETPAADKPPEPSPAPIAAAEKPPAEPAARKQSPSGVTTKPVPPGATRVRLEVHPADAKVGRRGVTQKPPYEFDVPKGKKLVLEVLRKGYTTRKVTLDGSSTRVVVGLARARSARGSR